MSERRHAGEIITFYSYKGGTGRSMALANVACLLARRQVVEDGKPVLAIDWDLEAPGLHRYFEPFLKNDKSQCGVVDLFYDVREQMPATLPDDREALAKTLVDRIDFSRYVEPTSFPMLSFFRAGRFDESYAERTNAFSWTALYNDLPSFFRLYAERLAKEYSFVLIDSRTGVTDISGICTMLLPEKLVVVFTPNRQSLTGITDLVRRATEYRRSSEDVRPIVAFPLPSRIETSMPDLKTLWRMGVGPVRGWQPEFLKLLGEVYDLDDEDTEVLVRYLDAVQVQHVAQYAYGEPIAVLDERTSDKLAVANSYAALRDYLQRGAPWIEEGSIASPVSDDPAVLRRTIAKLEERVGSAVPAPRSQDPLPQRYAWRALRIQGTIAGLLLLFAIVAVFLWTRDYLRRSANSSVLAQLLRPEAQAMDPNKMSLLLAQILPDLRGTERDAAVDRLRHTLGAIPKDVLWTYPHGETFDARFSDSGDRLVCSGSETIGLWLAHDGKPLDEWAGNGSAIRFVRASSQLISVSQTALDIWSGHDSKHIALKFEQWVTPTLTDDGRFLVMINSHPFMRSGGDFVSFTSVSELLQNPERAQMLVDKAKRVPGHSFECSRDSAVCVVIDRDAIHVTDFSKNGWRTIRPGRMSQCHVSGDGRYLVTIAPDFIRIFKADGAFLTELNAGGRDVAFSADGGSIAAALFDGSLRLFECPSMRMVATGSPPLLGAVQRIRSLPGGRYAVSYASDLTIVSPKLELLHRFHYQIFQYRFNASIDRLVLWSSVDVKLFDIGPKRWIAPGIDALVAETCARVRYPLSKEDWAEYFPNRDYKPNCESVTPLAN